MYRKILVIIDFIVESYIYILYIVYNKLKVVNTNEIHYMNTI